MATLRPLYGVCIQEAIASGDLSKMKSVAAEAEQYLAEHGNISAALEALKVEIAKSEAKIPPPIPLYAAAIQQAVASNDLGRMKSLAAQAEQQIATHGNISSALEALKIEIAKLGG